MSGLRVSIYDDDADILDQISTDIKDSIAETGIDIESIDLINERQIKRLLDRQKHYRDGDPIDWDGDLVFDQTDLFVVDYDLQLKLGPSATGEGLAYLARCFSNCGPIIVLNQFGRRPQFDLRLVPEDDSWADLNISYLDLKRQGLWQTDHVVDQGEFRPWTWPIITRLIDDFSKANSRVKEVGLEKTPPEITGYNIQDHGPPTSRAFDFFEDLSSPITESIKSHFEPRDETRWEDDGCESLPTNILANIVASRLRYWIHDLLLPAQTVMVDLPHLLSDYPDLLKESFDQIESWNRLCNLSPEFEPSDVANISELDQYRVKDEFWISRPAWFIEPINENDLIEESQGEEKAPFVFCEDASCFAPADEAAPFLADIPGRQANRFILRFDGVDYRPSNRLG